MGFVHAGQPSTVAAELSCKPIEVNFALRFRTALQRRLTPNASLHPKQLAGAIGRSDRAVHMMLAGDTSAHGETVALCIQFFWGIGDRAFLAEIYGLPPLMPVGDAIGIIEHARQAMEKVA